MKRVRIIIVGMIFLLCAAAAHGPALALTVQNPPPTTSAVSFPCPAGVSPTAATISRTNPLRNDLNTFPPFHRRVKNAALVQRLYRATCLLQPVSGVYHCPADFGIAYHVTFRQNGAAVLRVVTRASGCTWLHRVGDLSRGHAYWVWFGEPTSPPLPWMAAGRRWTMALGQALGLTMAELTPQP